MNNSPQKDYQLALEQAQGDASALESQLRKLSVARAAVFIAALAISIYLANIGASWSFATTLLVGGFAFLALLLRYNQLRNRYNLAKAKVTVNQEELYRLNGHWNSVENRFPYHPPAHHEYAQDLDLFGPSSLYLLLNRCGSWLGAQTLASWMLSPASSQEITRRHELVQSLRPNREFQERLQATGIAYWKSAINPKEVGAWVEQPSFLRKRKGLYLGAKIFPIIALSGLGITLYFELPWFTAILGLLGNLWIIRTTAAHIKQVIDETDKQMQELKQAANLMEVIENEPWETEDWKRWAALFRDEGGARAVKKLSHILYQLEARSNPWFFILVNIWILHDVRWLNQLEKWQEQYKELLPKWLERLGDIEALNSLAGHAYGNPQAVLPQILADEEFMVEAKSLGHPMLLPSERVANDFTLKGRGTVGILTGSNMSGKSTFERTLGINIVLALMGSTVCADSLTLSPVQVFTSMRTQDSLEENVSGFYAELKRLEQLLQLLEDGRPVLFLLDEILKGTNSADRNKGGKALLRQLAQKNAFGLISTHDLSLGEWAAEDIEHLKNLSFNSRIVDGKLEFDYKLSEGVCHSFSATALMRSIGIEVED